MAGNIVRLSLPRIQRSTQPHYPASQSVNSKGLFDKAYRDEVLEKMPFHKAEDYHQDYFTPAPRTGLLRCRHWPKACASFREKFSSRLKPTAGKKRAGRGWKRCRCH